MGPVNMQALILQCMQALVGQPQRVCIQLERPGCKDDTNIQGVEDTILLPEFEGRELQVRWHEYYAVAGILHRGTRADTGHFQVILGPFHEALLADENRPPRKYKWQPKDAETFAGCGCNEGAGKIGFTRRARLVMFTALIPKYAIFKASLPNSLCDHLPPGSL